jgi:nucleoside-diphosphate-sugar epimerase
MWVVLGGRGRIGRDLLRLLLSEGERVRVVGHASTIRQFMGCEYVCADVCDTDAIKAAIHGADVVVQSTTSIGDLPSALERDILKGTEIVVRECAHLRIPRFIYLSSICALDLSGDRVVTCAENADKRPNKRNYYARFKIMAERLIDASYVPGCFEPTILRPGIVLGPACPLQHEGIGEWVTPLICKPFGRGKNSLPFVLCEDVAGAIYKAACAPSLPFRSYNLVGDVRFSAEQFVALAARFSLRQFHLSPSSFLSMWAEAWLKWFLKAYGLSKRGRMPCMRDIKSMACIAQIDCSLAKQHLRWQPNADIDYFCDRVFRANIRKIKTGDLRL